MPPRPQQRRIKPANDPRPPRTLVITLPRAPCWKKSLVGSVVLLSLALTTFAVVTALRAPHDTIAQAVAPTVASTGLKAGTEPTLHDIILPAEQLSPDAKQPEETSLAEALGDLPVLGGLAQEKPPASGRVFLFQAAHALQRENYAAAADAYHQALTLNPRDTQALAGLAYAEAMQSRYAEAINANRLLVKLRPRDDTAQANLARLLMRNNEPRAALAAMDRAARLNPANLDYRFELATLYDRNGLNDQAAQLYRQLLDVAHHDEARAAAWPIAAIAQRLAYLETSSSDDDSTTEETDEPSTTSPVASR